jgi:putative addiction module component (TIGR02574 family)
MNARVKHLAEEAAKLTPEERVELIERIHLSLGPPDAEDAWDAEAHRRFEAYDRGELKTYSWDEIKQRRAAK